VIDSHVHLWGAEVAAADWLAGDATAAIRRPFAIAEYRSAAVGARVDGVVVVTAEESLAGNDRLRAGCAGVGLVRGIVGWVDLARGFEESALDGLIGIRHSVISEPGGWLRRLDVRAGIGRFARTGRVLELLVAARDLGDVRRCAEDDPGLTIVVDHLGDASTADDAWAAGIRALAPFGDVRVKLSGAHATARTVSVVLEALGADRVLLGSDWPVSTLRRPLGVELAALVGLLDGLSEVERERVLGGTATATYGLAS
jgi:L-fuconolactonase